MRLKNIMRKSLELRVLLECVKAASGIGRFFTEIKIFIFNKINTKIIGKIGLYVFVRHDKTKLAILMKNNM
jgi:acyl-ACP thioesterase